MKRLTLFLLVLTSISGAGLAEESFRDTVDVVSQPSPAHYVAYAAGLETKARMLDDERERIKGFGAAIVHLMAIPERWPDDHASIVKARLRIADISLEMGALGNASEQMDLAEQIATPEELPLIVRRRLEIATAGGHEDDGQRHAGWLNRGRIKQMALGERTPAYLAVVEFYESVGDHRNAGLRAAEFARSELKGVPAAALKIRAAHSFAAAKDREKVREVVTDARHDLLAASGSKDGARYQERIQALHKELDALLMEE